MLNSLDYLRYLIRDDWPWRGHVRAARAVRARLAPAIQRLPPIEVPASAASEVHVFSGESQAELGMVATWSLLRFLPTAALVIHSDGSLATQTGERWCALHPGARLLSPSAVHPIASAAFQRHRRISRWREQNWAAAQTLDFHLASDAHRIISLDTDVLCFREPTRVREWLAASPPTGLWNDDLWTRYSDSPERLESALGYAIAPRVNIGFCCTPRFGADDWDHLESALARMESARMNMNQRWSSQTYLAIMLARFPGSGALPGDYRVYRGTTRADSVIRHYVGMPSIRHRLFTEGWPRVLGDAVAR